MDIQYLSLKIYAERQNSSLEAFIPVFHSWIQEDACEELLIDVANYSHVPAGPGVMLIAHEANYAVEFGAENRFGFLYKTKIKMDGSNLEKLQRVFQQTLKAAIRLQEARHVSTFLPYIFRLVFDRRSGIENTNKDFLELNPALVQFAKLLTGSDAFKLSRVSQNPRERLTIEITNSGEQADIGKLLQNIETN